MKTIKIIISIILLAQIVNSQDLHYVQQDITKTLINPSYAGINSEEFSAGIIYRDQWNQYGQTYKTYGFGGELRLKNSAFLKNVGIGLWFDRDNAGIMQIATNQLGVSIAYHTKLATQHQFSAGIYAGMLNKTLSNSEMQWESQYNGMYYDANANSNETINKYTQTKPDVGVGGNYKFNNKNNKGYGQIYQLGVSAYHLNKPDMSYTSINVDPLYIRTVINAKSIIDIPGSMVSINPAITYMMQGPSKEMLLSLRGIFDLSKSKNRSESNLQLLWAGVHYRAKDAAVLELGMQTFNVAVSFSYDWTVSSLSFTDNRTGAFEISIKYTKRDSKYKGNSLL
jgi:type IX secretion system PorP/SprF family membrane protein